MAYLQVGDWEVDPAVNELRRNGEAIRLEPKAIEVLRYLAERPGEVVGREALLSAVWPGVVVGDDALTQAIIKLRRALGDDAHAPASSSRSGSGCWARPVGTACSGNAKACPASAWP